MIRDSSCQCPSTIHIRSCYVYNFRFKKWKKKYHMSIYLCAKVRYYSRTCKQKFSTKFLVYKNITFHMKKNNFHFFSFGEWRNDKSVLNVYILLGFNSWIIEKNMSEQQWEIRRRNKGIKENFIYCLDSKIDFVIRFFILKL